MVANTEKKNTTRAPKAVRSYQPEDSPSMHEWEAHFPGMFDNLLFVQASANVIMQLANPAVGYGVKESIVDSGNIFKRPWKRTRTTIQYLAVAIIGTAEEKKAYRKAIGRAHRHVHSRPGSKVKYNAFDDELQLWVASCLFWGYYDMWCKLHGKPDIERANRMLHMLEPLATTLQVRPERWHKDLNAFEVYWKERMAELDIDDTIRQYLTDLTELKFLNKGFQLLFGGFNRFVTAGFLPPEIREQMQMDWSNNKDKVFRLMLRAIGLLNRATPLAIRGVSMNICMWDLRRRLRKGQSPV